MVQARRSVPLDGGGTVLIAIGFLRKGETMFKRNMIDESALVREMERIYREYLANKSGFAKVGYDYTDAMQLVLNHVITRLGIPGAILVNDPTNEIRERQGGFVIGDRVEVRQMNDTNGLDCTSDWEGVKMTVMGITKYYKDDVLKTDMEVLIDGDKGNTTDWQPENLRLIHEIPPEREARRAAMRARVGQTVSEGE